MKCYKIKITTGIIVIIKQGTANDVTHSNALKNGKWTKQGKNTDMEMVNYYSKNNLLFSLSIFMSL